MFISKPLPTLYEKNDKGEYIEFKETVFKKEHLALLRERLVWVFKKSPQQVSSLIDQTLKIFALSIKDYCKHDDYVFIDKEKKNACLNCGFRFILRTIEIDKIDTKAGSDK